MNSFFKGASVALGATVALSGAAIAEDHSAILNQVNQYNDSSSLAQINNVFQLRDVSPSDWAFDALRNLVDNYNCIAGYPNSTFRGDRPLSRYEFAAGLNACLQQIERRIAGGGDVNPADLTRLNTLTQQFQTELAGLQGRVTTLEGQVAALEENQFSTTTKLKGEVIFTIANAFGDDIADGDATTNDDLDSQVTFNNRVRLNLDTSFREDGRDRLRTRLQAGNFGGSGTLRDDITGTDSTRLGHDASTGNSVEVDDLYYRFPVGDNTRVYVSALGLGTDGVFEKNNPYFASSGSGALSRFFRRNPNTLRRSSGAGVAFNHTFSDAVKFSAAYLVSDSQASNPSSARGLFDGEYSLGAQLALSPSDSFNIAFTYVNGYDRGSSDDLSGSTTDGRATNLFGGQAISTNNFGISSSWAITEKFNLSGWVGYTDASNEQANEDAELWNWAAHLALKDVGGEGNVLGFMFGQPPRVTSNDNALGDDGDTSYMAELQYRYKLSKNILITPGAYAVFNANHNDTNDTIWVGAIRTTFKF